MADQKIEPVPVNEDLERDVQYYLKWRMDHSMLFDRNFFRRIVFYLASRNAYLMSQVAELNAAQRERDAAQREAGVTMKEDRS